MAATRAVLPKGGRPAWWLQRSQPAPAEYTSMMTSSSSSLPSPSSSQQRVSLLSSQTQQAPKAFVIGVCGGTASGKTTVCERIVESLGVRWILQLSMDNFYNGVELAEGESAAGVNFDHPDAFDLDLLVETLTKLKRGVPADIPYYNFTTHSRVPDRAKRVYGADVILFEGIFAFYDARLRDLCDMKIFAEEDDDVRLLRRIRRDVAQRGRSVEGVIDQYLRFVKPSYENYVVPQVRHADIIVPSAGRNTTAIDLITKYINARLRASGFDMKQLSAGAESDMNFVNSDNVTLLPQRPQLLGMHTILRNSESTRSQFIFSADRISRLLIEKALDTLEYCDETVSTPVDTEFSGIKLVSKLCAVSIVRAGEAMESPLYDVCGAIPIGKLLIQSIDKQPLLFYAKLCPDIDQRTVFLLDATLGTGAAALMAVRVLLEHGVPEDKIVFITLIATPMGIGNLLRAHPHLRIVTSAVDRGLHSEKMFIVPGVGNFGDRYFGTEASC